MTKDEFIALCGSLLIAPEIALEVPGVREELKKRNDKGVRNLLYEEI